MDGKLPPWNIHENNSNSVPYTSGEHQEAHDLIGENMPPLSSCMSGAFRALLPDYHGTSSVMTTNLDKYSYPPDDHCVRSGTGLGYLENTIERREKLSFMKDPPDEASVTPMLPPKCTQYLPQRKDRELDHGNSSNWTSVIKHALEMSNGMEMEQTLSVDFNHVYKEPKPNNKLQDGREFKRGQDSFVAMLSDGISKQQNIQEMGINQKSDIFAEGSSLRKEEFEMTDIKGHEPVSLPGFYTSQTRHSLEGYMKCDEFSDIPVVKQSAEHIYQKTTQGPGISCKVDSPRKPLESHTNSCFNVAKVNNETALDSSAVCVHNHDLRRVGQEVTDGKISVNSQHHPMTHNDEVEMVHQSNLHVSQTTLSNQASSSQREERIESNLSMQEQTETKGSVNTTNTELSLKLEAKFAPEIVSVSNMNSSSVSEKVSEQPVLSIEIHSDDKKDQTECEELKKLCFQENSLNGTVTLDANPKSIGRMDVCDINVQEKQTPENQGTVLIPSEEKIHTTKICEQTFVNNAAENNNHSSQHNQNALQRHKKPRKRKKSDHGELNGHIHKSSKTADCSPHKSETLDDALKPDHDVTALEDNRLTKNHVSPPSQSKRKALKKSKTMSEGEVFIAPESPCDLQLQTSHEQPDVMADTTDTSQKPGHSGSEASHEENTPDTGNMSQNDDRKKPSHSTRKTVYGRKRKRISKLRLKAKISTILSDQRLSQNIASSEDFTSHSQVNLVETKPANEAESQQTISSINTAEIPQKSRKKKTLQTIKEDQGDSLQTSEVCQTASQLEDIPSLVNADQVGYKVKRFQKARRPAVKAFGDKNDKHATNLQDGESLVDSVSQTDCDSTLVSNSSLKNNQRKPRQKKRADDSEAAETLNVSPAVVQQKDNTIPLSEVTENMKTTKKTRPVKAKRPVKRASRKNLNADNETPILDIETITATLKQDSVLTAASEVESLVNIRTQKTSDTVRENCKTENTKSAPGKRKKTDIKFVTEQTIGQTSLQQEDATTWPSKSGGSKVTSNPEKTRRSSNNTSRRKTNDKQLNNHLYEETSVLSAVTQENSISPIKIVKKSRKTTVSEIKDVEVNHTESQHELTAIPDSITAAPSAKKSKRPAKKSSKKEVKNDHDHATLDIQTDTCVPTPFVLTTQKKSKKIKKMSDIKDNAINTPADVQTMPHQDISPLLQESEDSIVPLKKRRVRTHLNELISPVIENPVDDVSATETNYSDVFSQQNTVKTKRAIKTKKGTRRKTKIIQTIRSFEEQISPATVQEQNSERIISRENNKNPTSDPNITNNINVTAEDHGKIHSFMSTEDIAGPQSSQKKPKKKWLKQIEKNEQTLHHTTETTNNLKMINEVETMSDLTSVLKESVSENLPTSEADVCDQKPAKRKSKRFMEIAKTPGSASFSLSRETLSPSKIKTEVVDTDIMVNSTHMQHFFKSSDDQTINGLQVPEKESSEVDQKDPTVKGLKVRKAPKTKKRKTAKKKRRMTGLLTQKIKEEEQKDNKITCNVQSNHQTQTSNNSQRTADIPEDPVKSNVHISRKSTRIRIINSGPDETVSTQVDSTVTLDVTESSTTLKETLSSSLHNCKDLNNVQGILISTEQKTQKRGRPRKHKLPVTHLVTAPVQISDLPSCQSSMEEHKLPVTQLEDNITAPVQISEDTIKKAANPVNLKVVQPLKKKRGRKIKKKKKFTVTKALETDLSEQNVTDLSNNTLSQSITGYRHEKYKNLEAPARNLRVSSRTSELGNSKTDTSSLQQNSTTEINMVGIKASRQGTGMKRKLDDRTTIQDEVVAADVKIEEINHVKQGQRRQNVKELCFDELETQPEQPQQNSCWLSEKKLPGQPTNEKDGFEVCSEICDLVSSSIVREEEPGKILLDTTINAYTDLRSETGPENSPETETANNVFQPSELQKVDGFTQYSEEHVAMQNKLTQNKTIGFKAKEKVKKPLTCKYCGVSFRHITAYVIHQRIHTGEKPYKCKTCGKSFAQLSKLKSHRNVHKQSDSFPCPCCSQTFLQREDLISHFKVHLPESKLNTKPKQDIENKRDVSNNYSCKICKKNFANDIKLQTHMQEHEANKSMTCKDCGKKFWKSSSLAVHEKIHWPVKPYACSICGKGFNQLKALKKHSQDHTGETPFSCSHCGHAFSALSALRMHQASKTCVARRNEGESYDVEGFIVSQGIDGQVNMPVFFKCQICKQLFKTWCQYTLHLQTHTSSSSYLCFSCGQCYEKDSEVNVHCKVCCQASGEEKTCGASVSEIMQGFTQTHSEFNSISKDSSDSLPSLLSTGIQLNVQTPTNPEKDANQSPNRFPTCQSPARSEISCTSSLECIEISPSLWKFQCSRCGQRFKRYRALCAHMQTHAPAFRYTCAHCGQFFERWSKLWLHQRRHRVKGRCYSCMQCSLQFRFLSSYKEHMLDHAGQRPYACPLCPKTFIQEESLHAHQYESHKLCESLKCDVCSKTFSSLRNLIKHSLLHNSFTSHVCLLCSLSFTNTRALQQHLNTHTGYHGLPLPDIPSEPLTFPHKCKRCKACFSSGDLLYAHQICHSRDGKMKVRPEVQTTSKVSKSVTPLTNLKLDAVPNDKSLYIYSHPDRLYMTPSLSRVRHQVIHLDSNEHGVSDSQSTNPEMTNSTPSASSEGSTQDSPVVTSHSDSTHLPQETTNLKSNDIITDMTNDDIQNQNKHSPKHQRKSAFVETSIDMEVETVHDEFEESFECADCTEKLTSVLGLYEHYILHALGDTYV